MHLRVGKSPRDVGSKKTGATPAISNGFAAQLRETVIKPWSEPSGGERQTKPSVISSLRYFYSLREPHQHIFLGKEDFREVPKDKDC